MKVKYINESSIENEDIELYRERTSKLKGYYFTANDVGIDKRIVSVRVLGDADLILINPKIVNTSTSVVYHEKDTNKLNKVRKTIRYKKIVVQTDNLGMVEFKPTSETETWKAANDFFEDGGLLESVLVQRAIDAINGIDITNKNRIYTETLQSKQTPGRNEKVMLATADGDSVFVKYKKAGVYFEKGYNLI